MANDPKRLSTEELAKQAQKIKRTTDTIDVLEGKPAIAARFVKSLYEPLKETVKETAKQIFTDAKFMDTLALAVAKRITTNGEALKTLLENPDMFDKVVKGVSDTLQPDMESVIKEEMKKLKTPTADDVAAKLVDTVADKIVNPVALQLKPTFDELAKSHIASGMAISPLSSRKGLSPDEIPPEILSARLSPHAGLSPEQAAVLDMLARNPAAFELIVRNYPRLKATCEEIANAEIMAVLLSDDSQEKMFDLLHQDPETTLKALVSLTRLTTADLKDSLAKVAQNDSGFNLLKTNEFDNMLNEAAERIPALLSACMVRQTAIVLNDTDEARVKKRLSELGSIYNQGVLSSLDSIASAKTTDKELSSALACVFPRPSDMDSALKGVRVYADAQLNTVLDSQFVDAIKSNNQEEELYSLVSFAPGYLLGRLRNCVRDYSYLETVAGKNLGTSEVFRSDFKQAYQNVLLRHIGRTLQDSVEKSIDPHESMEALKAEGHDTVLALMAIANDTVLSTPEVRSMARSCIISDMITYEYYFNAVAASHLKQMNIIYPSQIDNDENLLLELYGAISRMPEEEFRKVVLSSFGVSNQESEKKAKEAMVYQYSHEVRRRVFNALVLPSEGAARAEIDKLGPEHKQMVRNSLETLRSSVKAADEFDDEKKYGTYEARIAIMRRASSLLYPKDSAELVAAALTLDAAKSAIGIDDELDHLYEAAPETTLKHLSSLRDTFTLSAALATILGKNVPKEYLEEKATMVEGMYGSLMVAESVRLLREPAYTLAIKQFEFIHGKEAVKQALKHVLADEDLRNGELSKLLPSPAAAAVAGLSWSEQNASPVIKAALEAHSEAVAKESALIARRAKDSLYGFKGRVRVASAVLDQDADDLETIFNANMWDTLADLKELREESILRRDLFDLIGASPEDAVLGESSKFVEGYYMAFLVGAVVTDLSKKDSRSLVKQSSSEHPGDLQAALRLVSANENGLIEDDLAKLYPADSLEAGRAFIIRTAQMHLAVDEMKAKALSTVATSSEPAKDLSRVCMQNPDVAAMALQDINELTAEQLNDRMSEAAGMSGRRFSPEVVKLKSDALKSLYSRSVRMLVVRAQGLKAPSERLVSMEAIGKEHTTAATQAVSTLLSSKKYVQEDVEAWAGLNGAQLDKSKVKEFTNDVYEKLRSMNQGGRK